MGLLSGMASFFHIHLDEEKKAAIRDEIDLAEAVEAHINWKIRLKNYLDGKSDEQLDPLIISRDDQCKLGQWIHGPALRHFHDSEQFRKLRADHAQFHFVAGNVVEKAQSNDRAAADELFKGEYQRISHDVVMALTELNRLVNQ